MGDFVAGEALFGMKDRGSVADQRLSASLSGVRFGVDGLYLSDFGDGMEPVAMARRSALLSLMVPTTGLRFSNDGALSSETLSRFGATSGLFCS